MSGIVLGAGTYTATLGAGSDAVNSVAASVPNLIPVYGIVIGLVLLLALVTYVIYSPIRAAKRFGAR